MYLILLKMLNYHHQMNNNQCSYVISKSFGIFIVKKLMLASRHYCNQGHSQTSISEEAKWTDQAPLVEAPKAPRGVSCGKGLRRSQTPMEGTEKELYPPQKCFYYLTS